MSWQAVEGAEKRGETLNELIRKMEGGEYISRDNLIETLGPQGIVSDVNDPRHPAYRPPGGGGDGQGIAAAIPEWQRQGFPS